MKKFFRLSKSKQNTYEVNDFEYVKGPPEFAKECLKAHNHYRAVHGAPPLVLDQTLNNFAFEWATKLANNDTLLLRTDNPHGENLYVGQNSSPNWQLNPMAAVKSWYNEETLYKYGEPDRSSLEGVGQFTQVVWKTSQKLGVGFETSKSGKTYVVCNYEPAGNTIGQFEANVLPAEPIYHDIENCEKQELQHK